MCEWEQRSRQFTGNYVWKRLKSHIYTVYNNVIYSLSVASLHGSDICSLLIMGISPEGLTRSNSYQSDTPSLYPDVFRSYKEREHMLRSRPAAVFDVIACAERVRARSICMMMLSWYRPVSESKARHKLARLPVFKENTLINFHWLWNAGSLFEFCESSQSEFLFLFNPPLFFPFLSFSVHFYFLCFSQSAFLQNLSSDNIV